SPEQAGCRKRELLVAWKVPTTSDTAEVDNYGNGIGGGGSCGTGESGNSGSDGDQPRLPTPSLRWFGVHTTLETGAALPFESYVFAHWEVCGDDFAGAKGRGAAAHSNSNGGGNGGCGGSGEQAVMVPPRGTSHAPLVRTARRPPPMAPTYLCIGDLPATSAAGAVPAASEGMAAMAAAVAPETEAELYVTLWADRRFPQQQPFLTAAGENAERATCSGVSRSTVQGPSV
ncbi:unnamed protein product, partial [Phaeothamnion confervicola]